MDREQLINSILVRDGEPMNIDNDHQASIDVENLATSMRREMGALRTLSNQCCIYRVRERLVQLDEKAYMPRIVSIGPLHHGKEQFQAMEEYKRKCLQDFLQRTNVSLEDFIRVVKAKEARLRNCYAQTIHYSSDEFVKMILVDAAFIIEVLLGYKFFINGSVRVSDDRLYNKPWLIGDVKVDIWLLENQIPFFILEDLFALAKIKICSEKDGKLSMLKLVHEFSKNLWDFFMIDDNLDERKYSNVEHLVDFLRICILPPDLEHKKRPKTLTTPSVTKLHQAGVKLRLGSGKNLFDIRFRNGILEIPHIKLRRSMEVLLRNVFAFEQFHCMEDFINDYVVFISYLIDTKRDAELLVQEGIIEHRFRDNEAVSKLFRKFTQGANLDRDDFYFSSLVEDLNRYCRSPWHKWRTTLKKNYFNTPWTTISVLAAFILIILTFIQTICSILQVN